MKQTLFKLIAIFLSVSFALLLSEGLLRLTWTPWDLRNVVALHNHPVYDYAPIPGISGSISNPEYEYDFTHSVQGMRYSPVFSDVKASDEKRILLVGDSFTYGVGSSDEETYAGYLRKDMPNYQFANTGCNGYGTKNVLSVIDFLGSELQPDLIIYFFFWNDLSDNVNRPIPEYEWDEEGSIQRVDTYQYEYSPLHQFPQTKAALNKSNPIYVKELISDGLKSLRYKYFGMRLSYVYEPSEIKAAWKVTEQYLQMIQMRSNEINAKFLVVALPDHNQINPEAVIKNIKPYLFEIQDQLKATCARHDIAFYDLLPEVKQSWEEEQVDYYYYADRHLTPAGNRVVAQLVQQQIDNLLFE